GTQDPSDEVRRLAQESLEKAVDSGAAIHESGPVQIPSSFDVDEAIAPDSFEICWQWLERKLVTTLQDEVAWNAATTLLNDEQRFGERLESPKSGITLLRLAKDASELPRDRSIWPTTNLLLAW